MQYNLKNSQRYFFITTILSKYKHENCIYTKKQLIDLFRKTLPVKNKYGNLMPDIINNIENIDNTIQKYLNGNIELYNQKFINILRCMIGQMLYQKSHLDKHLSYTKLQNIRKIYHIYIGEIFKQNTNTKTYHLILKAIYSNVYIYEIAPYYEKIYFILKQKLKIFKKKLR